MFFADGYTVSDVVMYWRDEPVVGVEDAELPQFTIVGHETNERKIKLATGKRKLPTYLVLIDPRSFLWKWFYK